MWWLLAAAHMTVVFLLSAQSGTGLGVPAPWDKVAHAVAYAVLGFLLTKATRSAPAGLVLAAWYGALDEVHQAFVPGRDAGVPDWIADVVGAYLGSALAGRSAEKRTRREPESVRLEA